MKAIAKRAASLAEMIAAGALIVGLLQMERPAIVLGVFFMCVSFGLTLLVDRFERGKNERLRHDVSYRHRLGGPRIYLR